MGDQLPPNADPLSNGISADTSSSTPTNPARTSSLSNPHLNPRSCVTCRRRKVRCNKENPCSNCVRAGIDCVFPGPGRAPRKSRKPPDAELLQRLKRLEGAVHSLGAQVDETGGLLSSPGPRDDNGTNGDLQTPHSDPGAGLKRGSMEKNLGRLVISEDRSRYVSNQFWASMGDEVGPWRVEIRA